MSILWTIIIGFLAGVIARFFHPGNKYEPKGFILTTLLGIVGAFVATCVGAPSVSAAMTFAGQQLLAVYNDIGNALAAAL